MTLAKKFLSCFLAVMLMSIPLSMFASADSDAALRFNEDGKFKIMIFADSQDDESLEETTAALMNEALDLYTPDLVIFLGDNTVAAGYDNQKTAIEAITAPCMARNVPFAMVFGNHDQEQGVEKEALLEIYRDLGCLTYDADPDLSGCGTCNLPILSSDGTKTAFNLWLIDSGSMNTDEGASGYDYVHADQLDWYKATSAALKEANGGEAVPSMNFQHIVIPEVYDYLYRELPFSLGALTSNYMGKAFSYIPKFTGYTGFVLEPPCPPNDSHGQLEAWLEAGDILAAFCGHDHINTYCVDVQGIENINVPSVGCSSYSKEISRGVGLITLDENAPADYEYQLIHIYDVALTEGSKISEAQGGKSAFVYKLTKFFSNLFTLIQKLMNCLSFG